MDQRPSMAKRIGRGLRRRCPNCGTGAFHSWFRMREFCEGCGLGFEREPGYWVGAVTINTTVTFLSFVVLFTVLTVLTWPEPPWGVIMASVIGVNLLVPVVFYPVSKTLWSALEHSWHPLEPGEFKSDK